MAWAFVQFAENSASASGGAISATFGANTSAGNSIIAVVGCNSSTDVPTSVTHNAVGLTLRDSITNGTDVWQQRWFTLDNIAGGATTVTYTPNANQAFRCIAVAEVSGLRTSGSYARGSWNRQSPSVTGADNTVSGTVDTSPDQVPYLQVCWSMAFNQTFTPAAGTGFTSRGTGFLFGGGTPAGRWADRNRSSTSATEQATATSSSAGDITYTGQIILLEPAAGSAAILLPDKTLRPAVFSPGIAR